MKNLKKKKATKSLFRKINDWLHLWLGLASGIVIFIVSVTGCLYAFQKEIKDATEQWRFVKVDNSPLFPPSKLVEASQKYLPDMTPSGITYGAKNEAAAVGFQSKSKDRADFSVVFLNPYNGKFLRKNTGNDKDFFSFVLDGHRALWLPYKIGRPIVGVAVLIFFFLIISGLVMWWPKKFKKNHLKQAFFIKYDAKFKRVNYDLHNVLGFYSFLLALIFVITGLTWSFGWFERGVHFITSGGRTAQEIYPKSSLPKVMPTDYKNPTDAAWRAVMSEIGDIKGGMYLGANGGEKEDPIEILVYNKPGVYYDRSEFYFDKYTLKRLHKKGEKYSEADFEDKFSMLNYDMHTGAALGLPGKILAFFVSLVCASLPITGFLIWWGMRKKKSLKISGK